MDIEYKYMSPALRYPSIIVYIIFVGSYPIKFALIGVLLLPKHMFIGMDEMLPFQEMKFVQYH